MQTLISCFHAFFLFFFLLLSNGRGGGKKNSPLPHNTLCGRAISLLQSLLCLQTALLNTSVMPRGSFHSGEEWAVCKIYSVSQIFREEGLRIISKELGGRLYTVALSGARGASQGLRRASQRFSCCFYNSLSFLQTSFSFFAFFLGHSLSLITYIYTYRLLYCSQIGLHSCISQGFFSCCNDWQSPATSITRTKERHLSIWLSL